jgi:hypothetical protein
MDSCCSFHPHYFPEIYPLGMNSMSLESTDGSDIFLQRTACIQWNPLRRCKILFGRNDKIPGPSLSHLHQFGHEDKHCKNLAGCTADIGLQHKQYTLRYPFWQNIPQNTLCNLLHRRPNMYLTGTVCTTLNTDSRGTFPLNKRGRRRKNFGHNLFGISLTGMTGT